MSSSQGSDETFTLAKAIGTSCSIDYFMSHSWHDIAETKYAKLEAVAAAFSLAHRRPPTFWLDKVCINQQNISDGLRVLPINVMACKKMLVLFGSSYTKRLWCIL